MKSTFLQKLKSISNYFTPYEHVTLQGEFYGLKMNFENLFNWIIGIVVSYALAGHLTDLNRWVYCAQAKAIYESRASSWGSPKFFPVRKAH